MSTDTDVRPCGCKKDLHAPGCTAMGADANPCGCPKGPHRPGCAYDALQLKVSGLLGFGNALASAAEKHLDNLSEGGSLPANGKAARLREEVAAFRAGAVALFPPPPPPEPTAATLAKAEMTLIVAREAYKLAAARLTESIIARDRACLRVLRADEAATALRTVERDAKTEYVQASNAAENAARALTLAEAEEARWKQIREDEGGFA